MSAHRDLILSRGFVLAITVLAVIQPGHSAIAQGVESSATSTVMAKPPTRRHFSRLSGAIH